MNLNLYDTIKKIFSVEDIQYSERSTILQIKFESNLKQLKDKNCINEIMKCISERDVIIIELCSDNDDYVIIEKCKLFPEADYDIMINSPYQDSIVEVKITINKKVVNGEFSVYRYESFAEYFLSLNVVEQLDFFALLYREQNQLVFEVFDKEVFFETETMSFVSNITDKKRFNRIGRLEDCKRTAIFREKGTYELLPDDFYFINDCTDGELCSAFGRLCSILSLAYIVSDSYIENRIMRYSIDGRCRVEGQFDLTYDDINLEYYKIYKWIYTDGNSIDKSILARDIICINCKNGDLKELNYKVLYSIQSNYRLYLKENVEKYMEMKKSVSEFICNVVAKTEEHAASLIDNSIKNGVAIFTFFFTVVMANVVSNQSIDNIFTRDITLLIEIALVGSFIYLGLNYWSEINKLEKIKASYNLLKQNYIGTLSDVELQDTFKKDEFLSSMVPEIKRKMKLIVRIWAISLLMIFVIVEMASEEPIVWSLIKKLIVFLSFNQ